MSTRFRIEITEKAFADLRAILAHVAQESPIAAQKLAHQLEEAADSLQIFPNRSPRISEDIPGGTMHRHLILGHYRMIFQVQENAVYIVRILHSSRLIDENDLKT